MFIVTVVREHSDIDTALATSEEEARAWLVSALYLVEEGRLPTDAPTPPLDQLREHAIDYGWEISLVPAASAAPGGGSLGSTPSSTPGAPRQP